MSKDEILKQLKTILEYDYRTDAKEANVTQIYRALSTIVVNYMKEGMGAFNTVSNSDAFAHIEEEVLGIFKNTTRLSSDYRFLVTDNLGGRDYVRKSSDDDNTASDCYIDVWELC